VFFFTRYALDFYLRHCSLLFFCKVEELQARVSAQEAAAARAASDAQATADAAAEAERRREMQRREDEISALREKLAEGATDVERRLVESAKALEVSEIEFSETPHTRRSGFR
jgi:predicted RNase H-like nuclease (RuvC/YqgF family)